MNLKHSLYSILTLGLTLFCSSLHAQNATARDHYNEGERLRSEYDFTRAQEAYSLAAKTSTDSSLIALAEQRIILCSNGISLLNFVATPKVLGRFSIAKKDFFLFYDLCPSGRWALPPKTLLHLLRDDAAIRYPLFYRDEDQMMVFSARDSLLSSGWDIYMTKRKASEETDDSHTVRWDAPQLIGTQINSNGDELYPVLSRDGETLYFCSDGQYGLGGFNLYKSAWDEDNQQWGPAENLGIPFSSPFDDLLFMPSDESTYLYFTSSRSSEPDSLMLYKLEFENSPIKIAPSSLEQLQQIAQLTLKEPASQDISEKEAVTGPTPDEEATQTTREALSNYSQCIQTVRALSDSVRIQEDKLKAQRELLSTLSREEDKAAMTRSLEEGEIQLMDLQGALLKAQEVVQKIENQFLVNGVLPPTALPDEKADSPKSEEEKPTLTPFHPVKQSLIILDNHLFDTPIPPEPAINMEFRIEAQAEIIPWENEPMGLYYRIQLFTLSQKASIKQLKGLCPAFEVKVGSKYVYYVGEFFSYAQAAKALSTVKGRGISSAVVVAYYEGKSIPVQAARKREAQKQTAPTNGAEAFQVFLADGEIGADLIKEVGALTTKDIVKVVTDEGTKFVIGPFPGQTEAESLAASLQEKGFSQVKVEPVIQ